MLPSFRFDSSRSAAMPPRLAKKSTVTKSKVSTPAASSPKVEMAPSPSTVSPAAAVEDTTGPKEDSFLKNDQTRKPDPIVTAGSAIESDSTKDGESSQIDPAIRARPAKKRVVAKVAASTVRKEAVASVARDQIEQTTGSLSGKEAETEKSEASKDGRECTVQEPIEEKPMKEVLEVNVGEEKERAGEGDVKTVKEVEENTEKIGGEKEIEEIPVSQEVKDKGEKIEKNDTEELANKVKFEEQLVEEGEPIEEEAVEEVEPIEEEAVEEGEPIEEEAVEGEPIEEDSVDELELIEEEPLEEEEEAFEEEEKPMEQEQAEEEPMEEEEEEEEEQEEEEEEEEPIEEEAGEGDGNEKIAKGRNNEENREIVAVKDVQLASVDGGRGEDQGLGDMLEPTMYLKALLPNRKVKDAQIFISQLEKTVVEEDIVKAFAGFGEIQSVRVIRHSKTQKSKGYAFLQYSTAEAAEKALSQLKDGTEIKGKTVHISASNQGTLFVGNICKSWSKDQVLDALKGLGVEGIDQIALPEDPKVEGKIKGFAFVEFCTHIDAKAALNRLCKPDAVLGCDYSAKVSFAQLPVNYIDELQAKVKTVYLEPVPMSWDGKKIEEICKEYGAIEKIKLYRKSQSRRKDFAFVEFVSQESALSCVEGLSKALLEQDDTKVSASLARPYAKKTGTKFILRGNFKVKKSNEKGEKEEEEARIIKQSDEKVEKEEVKIIEVSGNSKRKRKRPKSKGVIAQKPKPLSPQKAIKKNKMVHKKGPNIETPKETPHRNAPKKKPNKEAPVPVNPQGSRKRPFKEAPESSKRPFKGKMKQHEKGMRGGPHPHQSGAKKSKPFKGSSKQHQRGVPSFNKERGAAFNNERDFKRSRNDHYGNYHSHHGSSPIDRRLSLEYTYAPHPYTRHIHEPPYTSTSSIHEPPYTASMHEPSRREPYTYASGSYHSHHSDLAPHAGYVPPTHHAPRTRHVYEPSAPAPAPAPAPYGGGYDRPIVYTRELPIPPTTHPGFVTYPRYQQPSYPYPTGRSYPADYPPRRSYY